MALKIALFNMSGGVGKSTLTQNIGFHLFSDHQLRVLLVDMDPQASLTTFLGFTPLDFERTIAESLLDKSAPLIDSSLEWCDLVPANLYLAQLEMRLHAELQRELCLRNVLALVEDNYDVVLIDCPPSLGLLSINCMAAVNHLIIPIQTEYKSVEATLNLLQTTFEITQSVNKKLTVIGVVPTMFDKRITQARAALETIREVFQQVSGNKFMGDATIFEPIPRRTDFANAVSEHLPLALYAPNHQSVRELQRISQAIVSQVKLPVGAISHG